MAADKTIKQIISTAEKAVEAFQERVPGTQQGLLDSLLNELKGLSTQNGRVLNSVQNLKLIMRLRNKVERLIISEGYKSDVKQFIEAFSVIEGLQQQYFAGFNFKFNPSKTLPIVKEMAIERTVNGLLGQGLQAAVLDKIFGILQTNATTGGSYAALTNQLREQLLTTDSGDGSLMRHVRTFATDAINQYSAQYHDTLAQDLQLNWLRYVGSNLTTTREFCEQLAKKEWVHKSELPEIIKGNIDGHQCKLSKSTGLPLGMIPGTDANNFKVVRGGYNCGHQAFWVPDSAVPENVRARIKA